MKQKSKAGRISLFLYLRLIYRSVLFAALLISYLLFRLRPGEEGKEWPEQNPVLLIVTWVVLAAEMLLRFFPLKPESPGCQKHLARNFRSTGSTELQAKASNRGVGLIALLWLGGNGIFGGLHLAGILDQGFMLLLCSLYSILDMVCILFYCPFQVWFMKNRCCTVCRIYNWDYPMMCTPLLFVPRLWSWSLAALALGVLIHWEVARLRHPERFSEETNAYLQCQNCPEKLCTRRRKVEALVGRVFRR